MYRGELCVVIGEPSTFAGDPVDIWRSAAHPAMVVAAEPFLLGTNRQTPVVFRGLALVSDGACAVERFI